MRLRLVGVNAPENDECGHQESLEYLIDEVGDAEVAFETVGSDQFGRSLAQVWVGRSHVNRDLVASGHAIATTLDADDPYRSAILAAEADASATGLGIWSATACGATGDLPDIVIESADPDPAGRDEDDLVGESVVLANVGTVPIDLGGWGLRDESSRHRFVFRPDTWLAPDQTIEVTSADPGWDPGGSPVWNNDGDLVLLTEPSGRIVAHLRY